MHLQRDLQLPFHLLLTRSDLEIRRYRATTLVLSAVQRTSSFWRERHSYHRPPASSTTTIVPESRKILSKEHDPQLVDRNCLKIDARYPSGTNASFSPSRFSSVSRAESALNTLKRKSFYNGATCLMLLTTFKKRDRDTHGPTRHVSNHAEFQHTPASKLPSNERMSPSKPLLWRKGTTDGLSAALIRCAAFFSHPRYHPHEMAHGYQQDLPRHQQIPL